MHRTVRYEPGGTPIRTTPRAIVDCWRRFSTKIPAEFALGTASHEVIGLALNEVDHEPPNAAGEVYTSEGLYQLSRREAGLVNLASADLLSLDGATEVFAKLQEARLVMLLDAAKLSAPTPDVWAFLSVAHNQGVGAARETITFHGCDWTAYKARNIGAAEHSLAAAEPDEKRHAAARLAWWHSVASYGDDVVSGGPRWAEVGT